MSFSFLKSNSILTPVRRVLTVFFITSACFFSNVNAQPTALTVTDSSNVILMQYNVWFSPNGGIKNNIPPIRPSLSPANQNEYDSGNPAVIAQHLDWFRELKVDAVILDASNGRIGILKAIDVSAAAVLLHQMSI
jgi:hypothetical protein